MPNRTVVVARRILLGSKNTKINSGWGFPRAHWEAYDAIAKKHPIGPAQAPTINFTAKFQREQGAGAPNERGVGKIRNFEPISRRISLTVQDRT